MRVMIVSSGQALAITLAVSLIGWQTGCGDSAATKDAAPEGPSERERDLERQLTQLERKLDALNEEAEAQRRKTARPPPPPKRPPPTKKAALPRGPDLNAVYAIELGDSPFVGARDAKVTVVKAFEFACPYCEKVRPTLTQLLADYKGDIKIVYKHFVVHPQLAIAPAVAACAAGKQNKFPKMADALWDQFKKYRSDRDPKLMNASSMRGVAQRVRLRMSAYDRDIKACEAVRKRDEEMLRRVGITGTPAFFVNGRYIRGAQSLSTFKDLVDEELVVATERIHLGEATNANYYKRFVLDRGRTEQ